MNKSSETAPVIICSILILLVLVILQVIPLINGFILSFMEYTPLQGMTGSPFTGLQNYAQLFGEYHFWRVLLNTVKLNFLFLMMVMIVAFLMAISLSQLNKKAAKFFLILLLVPLFIPGSVLVHACIAWFQGTNVLISNQLFPLIYAFVLTVKNIGIPTIFILKTWQRTKMRAEDTGFERLMAPLAFVLVQLASLFSSDMDILRGLINPLVYSTGDTLDFYIYRMGFMQMQTTLTQPAWVIQLLIHLMLGYASYVLMKMIVKRQASLQAVPDNPETDNSEKEISRQQSSNPVGFIFPALYTVFLIVFVFKPFLIDGTAALFGGLLPAGSIGRLMISMVRYVFIYGLVALAGVPITVCLAKGANLSGGFGGFIRIALIFFFLTSGLGYHHYMHYRSLGLVNTVFSLILYYLFPIANSLVLAAIIAFKKEKEQGSHLFGEQSSYIWKSAFILGILQFIFIWNSSYAPLVFLSQPDRMPPVLISERLMMGAGAGVDMNAVLASDLLIIVIPIALLLVFRKHMTEWILLAYTKTKSR